MFVMSGQYFPSPWRKGDSSHSRVCHFFRPCPPSIARFLFVCTTQALARTRWKTGRGETGVGEGRGNWRGCRTRGRLAEWSTHAPLGLRFQPRDTLTLMDTRRECICSPLHALCNGLCPDSEAQRHKVSFPSPPSPLCTAADRKDIPRVAYMFPCMVTNGAPFWRTNWFPPSPKGPFHVSRPSHV